MSDLSTRTDRERELEAAALLVLRRHAREAAEEFPYKYDWERAKHDLQAAVAVPLAVTFGEAAGTLNAEQGAATAEPEIKRWADQWGKSYSAGLAATVTETIKADFEAVRTKPPDQWKAALTVVLVGLTARASSVGVTETTRAITAGESWMAERVMAAGIGTLHAVWNTELDAKVCPLCGPLHGEREGVFERVSPGGPPAHPNCRCWLTWEL